MNALNLNTRGLRLTATLVTSCLPLIPHTAEGAIIAYYEFTGVPQEVWGSSGLLVNGPLGNTNFSDITADQWIGAHEGYIGLLSDDGLVNYYVLTFGGDNPHSHSGTSATLTNGPLGGYPLKNEYWLGAADGDFYYFHEDHGVLRYDGVGNHTHVATFNWQRFTNGDSDGFAPSPGYGLSDFGGGNSMNESLFVTIDSLGTMEYYRLDNGLYSWGESEGGYGSWTTFTGGALDGLTLVDVLANPVGTHNGISYRFLGTSNEGMYFDVAVVPEPSAAFLVLGGAGLWAARRRRVHR